MGGVGVGYWWIKGGMGLSDGGGNVMWRIN